jgi:hypothetical protein
MGIPVDTLLVLLGGDTIDAVPRPLVAVSRLGGFTLNIAAGTWALWLYGTMRLSYGPGWKAAAIAGLSWWLIATITTWQWADIGFLRLREIAWLIVASLPTLVAVVIGAARCYEAGIRRLPKG